MSRKRLWTPELEEAVADMFRSGSSRDAMARAFNVSESTIGGVLHRLRTRGRIEAKPVETAEEKIIKRFKAGRSIHVISNVVKMTSAQVRKVLEENGFDVETETVNHDIHPMWGVEDEYTRRLWVAKKAQRGARETLKSGGFRPIGEVVDKIVERVDRERAKNV